MRRAIRASLPYEGNLADDLATCPRLLVHNAREWPLETAVREKTFGIWQETTWAQSLVRVRAIALGLRSLGIQQGDVVSYIGQNRADLVFTVIAIHALGSLSLGIYKESLRDELVYLINHTDVRVVVAEDEEQVDKFLDLADAIPGLQWIVYCDQRGMIKHKDPRLLSLTDLCAAGQRAHALDSATFSRLVSATSPDAAAILATTSGTTSHPKCAVLQSGPFLRHCLAMLVADPKGPDDDYVSVLPLPWIGEQIPAVGHFLLARMRCNFVEEEETTKHDMREIGPTFILYPPQTWEAIAADIKARIMESTWLKRSIHKQMERISERAHLNGRRSWLAEWFVGRALRDRIGLSRVRSALTGGAPLGPDVAKFFHRIGLPLRQVYGQTELMGIYCGHDPDDMDVETVGKPYPGVDIRIDNPDRSGVGEVVSRHANMFVGYYRNDSATRESLRDGWMNTGDAGYFRSDGHLVVLDRLRDMSTLANGDRFSPIYLENRLKFSAFIGECVVFGHGRPSATAIICIRYSIVSKWAEKRRIGFTTYADLAGRPEVRELVRAEIEAINISLLPSQRISHFILLYKELDADDGELTRTRKVRRAVISERYTDLIEAMYDGRNSVNVNTSIALQDGRRQRITAEVTIVTVNNATTSSH